jgi:hypothetical protein
MFVSAALNQSMAVSQALYQQQQQLHPHYGQTQPMHSLQRQYQQQQQQYMQPPFPGVIPQQSQDISSALAAAMDYSPRSPRSPATTGGEGKDSGLLISAHSVGTVPLMSFPDTGTGTGPGIGIGAGIAAGTGSQFGNTNPMHPSSTATSTTTTAAAPSSVLQPAASVAPMVSTAPTITTTSAPGIVSPPTNISPSASSIPHEIRPPALSLPGGKHSTPMTPPHTQQFPHQHYHSQHHPTHIYPQTARSYNERTPPGNRLLEQSTNIYSYNHSTTAHGGGGHAYTPTGNRFASSSAAQQSVSGLFPPVAMAYSLQMGASNMIGRSTLRPHGGSGTASASVMGASSLLRSVLRQENIDNDFYWLQQLQRDRRRDPQQLERSLQFSQSQQQFAVHPQHTANFTQQSYTPHQAYNNNSLFAGMNLVHNEMQPQGRPFSLMRNTSIPDIDTDSSTNSIVQAHETSPTNDANNNHSVDNNNGNNARSSNSDSNLVMNSGNLIIDDDVSDTNSPPTRLLPSPKRK